MNLQNSPRALWYIIIVTPPKKKKKKEEREKEREKRKLLMVTISTEPSILLAFLLHYEPSLTTNLHI